MNPEKPLAVPRGPPGMLRDPQGSAEARRDGITHGITHGINHGINYGINYGINRGIKKHVKKSAFF